MEPSYHIIRHDDENIEVSFSSDPLCSELQALLAHRLLLKPANELCYFRHGLVVWLFSNGEAMGALHRRK